MSKETGGPAFPIQGYTLMPNGETVWPDGGMTLRDYFAAKAMSGALAGRESWPNSEHKLQVMAASAYAAADAMLAERDK